MTLAPSRRSTSAHAVFGTLALTTIIASYSTIPSPARRPRVADARARALARRARSRDGDDERERSDEGPRWTKNWTNDAARCDRERALRHETRAVVVHRVRARADAVRSAVRVVR